MTPHPMSPRALPGRSPVYLPRVVPVIGGPAAGELVQRQGLSMSVIRLHGRPVIGHFYPDAKPPEVSGRYTTFVYRLMAVRPHPMVAPFDVYVPQDLRDPAAIRALYGEYFTGGDDLAIDPDDARWPSNRPWR